MVIWSWREELNPRPADYKSAALPTELHQRCGLPTDLLRQPNNWPDNKRVRILVQLFSRGNEVARVFPKLDTLRARLDLLPEPIGKFGVLFFREHFP